MPTQCDCPDIFVRGRKGADTSETVEGTPRLLNVASPCLRYWSLERVALQSSQSPIAWLSRQR